MGAGTLETIGGYLVKPAVTGDLLELHALIERAYRGESAKTGWTNEADLLDGPRTDLATLSAAILDEDEVLLTFREGRAMVGCVQITRRSPTLSYLGLVTVDPQLQARGLGRLILQAAEREAAKRFGSKAVELSVLPQRSELVAYYQRRGYVLTGEERPFPVLLDPPFTLVVLMKHLTFTL